MEIAKEAPRPSYSPKERFHALDLLRCCAFILLIWVHAAQLFLPYGWWNLSLPEIPILGPFVRFCRQWRMDLVFLVSGVALSYSFDKRGGGAFLLQSAKRILPPLLFGMAVLTPPVLYYERRGLGQAITLLEAYWLQAQRFMAGEISWYTFWYLAYLFLFCCIVAVLWSWWRPLVLRARQWWPASNPPGYLLALALGLPLALIELLLGPYFPDRVKRDFVSDIDSLAIFFVVFNYGAIALRNPGFLGVAARNCGASFVLAAILAASLWRLDTGPPDALFRMAKGLNTWLWLLFFVGIACRCFNRERRWVSAFNRIVFPFYLLQQVAILTAAWALRDTLSGLPLYFAIVAVATLGSIALIQGVMMPLKPLHRLFGIAAR